MCASIKIRPIIHVYLNNRVSGDQLDVCTGRNFQARYRLGTYESVIDPVQKLNVRPESGTFKKLLLTRPDPFTFRIYVASRLVQKSMKSDIARLSIVRRNTISAKNCKYSLITIILQLNFFLKDIAYISMQKSEVQHF